jgi:uncharacterized membrane protein
MKILFGLLIIIASVLGGIYIGVWVCFIGGIVDVITALQASPIDALGIAWGIFKFLIASVAGVWAAVLGVVTGLAIMR